MIQNYIAIFQDLFLLNYFFFQIFWIEFCVLDYIKITLPANALQVFFDEICT